MEERIIFLDQKLSSLDDNTEKRYYGICERDTLLLKNKYKSPLPR